MKKIISFLIIILIQALNLKAEDFKLNQIISGFNTPWSLTFKNQNEIEQKITKKSKAIIVMHYAGFPCDMDEIVLLAKKHKLFVIED